MTDYPNRFVLVTGCSGGGKSSLVAELARRGFATVEEPGRRIVREECARDGDAVPWRDREAFLERCVALALDDRESARVCDGWVFFDRGLIDAVAWFDPPPLDLRATVYRYHERIFLAPPWPAIYRSDAERRHGFDEAVAEHRRIAELLPRLGYETVALPEASVSARADFVTRTLGPAP